MTIIKEQPISWIEKGFNWVRARLTEETVTDIPPQVRANHEEKLPWLNERTKCWSKAGQRQQQPEYQKQWAKWNIRGITRDVIIAFLLIVSTGTAISSTSPSGTYSVGDGVVWVGDLIVRNDEQHFECGNYLYSSNLLTGVVSSGAWGESGGYMGVKLAEDVVLFFTGSMRQVNRFVNTWVEEFGSGVGSGFTTIFSETGHYSSNVPDTRMSGVPNTIINVAPGNYSAIKYSSLESSDTSFSLVPSLYVGPNAVPGSYSVTNSIGVIPSCNYGKYTVVSTGTINIVAPPPRLCNLTTTPSTIFATAALQTMKLTEVQSGAISVRGNCSQGGQSTEGNLQFSILADNPVASTIGGANTALALLTSTNDKVGSVYFENSAWSSNYLSVTGNKYSVPVQWSNINFNVNYTIVDLAPSDTPALGVGRGTAKFVIEWP